jgi:hypothetical protein
LRPAGCALRDRSLHELARALGSLSFEQQPDRLDALTECVSLCREVLQLRPLGHFQRWLSVNNLALALMRSFEVYGDPQLLAEAVDLHRQAVVLCAPGHPNHNGVLNNLGGVLHISFEHQGGFETLAEAIRLLREVLQFRPPGHHLRVIALDNLATALLTSFSYQGRSELLTEAISHHREALQLVPGILPKRAQIIEGLAKALLVSFREQGGSYKLTEVTALLREALILQPPGHRMHSSSLHNLAKALQAVYDADGDGGALSESLALHRQALQLRSQGHWLHLASLEDLADLLCRPECCSWSEALDFYRTALDTCPTGYPARARLLSSMSKCFLTADSPFFDLSEGISHLHQAYADSFSHVNQRLKSALHDLRRVEQAQGVTAADLDWHAQTESSSLILDLYAQVIGLLPRAANLGLDHSTRLQAVAGSDEIPRNAAARALLFDRVPQAVEMLEEGRGVFWSQALCLSTSGFDGVPDNDRQELQRLLRLLEHGARRLEKFNQSEIHRERELETQRRLNEEAEALISKIRNEPGLERFLLPPAFIALFSALPDGFIVIVNTSKLGHHALLLHRVTGIATSLELKPACTGFDTETLSAR